MGILGELEIKGGRRAALSRMWVVTKIVNKILNFFHQKFPKKTSLKEPNNTKRTPMEGDYLCHI